MNNHIVLGDVHLGKSLSIGKPGSNGKLNSRVQDQLDLLDNSLFQAKKKNANHIVITGDIYEEPRPHPALIQYFLSWLKACERAGIEVDIIVGNHDIVRSGSYSITALDIVPAVELTHARVHKNICVRHYDGVSFIFMPYRDRRMYDVQTPLEARELLKNELDEAIKQASIPSGNKSVLVGHLALEGSLPIGDEIGEMLNEIFCPLDMFSKFDYVWMGHIHKPQVMREKPNRIAHIGSMDRSDFSKTELDHEKHLVLITPGDDEFFQEIKLPTRQLRKVQISVPSGKETTEFILNSLYSIDHDESLKDSTMRLEITLEDPEAIGADRDKVFRYSYDKLGVHYVCGFSETHNLVPIAIEESAVAIFDNALSVNAAIEAFFNSAKFDLDEDRDACKELAFECYTELKESGKNKKEEAA